MTIYTPTLVTHVVDHFVLNTRSIHGPAHWMRVRTNGLLLADHTGANRSVIELFALLHDSCRLNDDWDQEHGPRAAEFASDCFKQNRLPCDRDELDLLTEACAGHTVIETHHNNTIATCWDADRLDLWRAWIMPDPDRLCTQTAKQREVIDDAVVRSLAWMLRVKKSHD